MRNAIAACAAEHQGRRILQPVGPRPRRGRSWGWYLWGALWTVLGTACSLDGLLNSNQLPPDVTDPAITQTPEGARFAYNGVVAKFRAAFGDNHDRGSLVAFVPVSGLLSDELHYFGSSTNITTSGIDQRSLPEDLTSNAASQAGSNAYASLQKTRAEAGQAIHLLAGYLPSQPALAGRLYALQGYTELFLAELFCSGIPLSTIDYTGDYTYKAGSSTEEVLSHAVALFDTALVLAADSTRFVSLARVGRGRALLGLGMYSAAAAAVAAVPDGYRYNVEYNRLTTGTGSARNFASIYSDSTQTSTDWPFMVPDREGGNGLNWRTSSDPRTPIVSLTTTFSGTTYRLSTYAPDGSSPIVLASGVEARLIEAEAQLQAGDGTWLATLNALRTDGMYDTTATSPPDTLWHAGSGGVAGLAPLADPGSSDARVDLLFRERAFWLFLTGHRQGDLRRLIRQYNRSEGEVYPVGAYPGYPFPYGPDVTLPIPTTEFVNPLFTGCASRSA